MATRENNTNNFQDKAYETIKDMIISMELMPGEKIVKKILEEKLDIGTTPIREAIIRLQREGLFVVVPQSGTYVAKINMQKVDAARFVRKSIEPIVMADACKIITPIQLVDLERNVKIQRIYIESGDQKEFFKLDDEFHAAIYSIADKPDVWAWIQQIGINLNRFRMLSMQGREYNWPAVLGHHEQMLKLLEAHDSKGLKAVVNEHLNHINDFSDGVRDSYPEYVE